MNLLRELAQLTEVERDEAILILTNGRRGLRVSLHYWPQLAGKVTRITRKKTLSQIFKKIENELSQYEIDIALDSISISSQTVDATIPVDKLSEAEQALREHSVNAIITYSRFVELNTA